MDHRANHAKHEQRSGQAMAEFLVGLVAIMLLVAGLQQIAFLSQDGYAARNDARRAVARQLMDPLFVEKYDFGFGDPTRPGGDRKPYTGDDRRAFGNDSFYQESDGYLEKVYDADIVGYFDTYDRELPHSDLEDSDVYVSSERFKMFHASIQHAVDVVPFLDRVLGKETLTIGRDQDIVMPRLDRVKR